MCDSLGTFDKSHPFYAPLKLVNKMKMYLALPFPYPLTHLLAAYSPLVGYVKPYKDAC